MKSAIIGLIICSVSTANAVFVPASETRQSQAPQIIDIRTSVTQQIAARTLAGYHFVSIDMDGATWKVENEIMKELRTAGYSVEYGNDHHVYGWNSLNGALVVRWVK